MSSIRLILIPLLTCSFGISSPQVSLSTKSNSSSPIFKKPISLIMADKILDMANKNQWSSLKSIALNSNDTYLKIFASLVIFEKDPAENKLIFLKSLPKDKTIQNILVNDIYLFPSSSTEEQISTPANKPWVVTGPAVFNAAAKLAEGGDITALTWCWNFQGFNTAEDTEGQTEWQSNLFKYPELILNHWDFFKNKLEACQLPNYLELQELTNLKEHYTDVFYYHPNQLNKILPHLTIVSE